MKQFNTTLLPFMPLFFLIFGIISIVLFHTDVYFPISLSVALMAFIVFYFIYQLKIKKIGVLIAILFLVYLLPFIHIPPYIWFDFNSSSVLFWGLAVNPYMLDKKTIELTAMLGTIGALGMAFAISFAHGQIIRDNGLNTDGTRRIFRSLSMPIWLLWVFFGIGFSWISAPQETIFVARYTTSTSIHAGANFSSAWMMSYVILSFTFIDALIDRNPVRRFLKWNLILVIIAFIFIFLQLLRGDRESVPWIFALALIYYYWTYPFLKYKINYKIPWRKIVFWIFFLIFGSIIVGAIRHNLVGADISHTIALINEIFSEDILYSIFHGTWSAVLLTPLSVSGDHINNLLKMKWGEDYLNLFLSLPPGFIADALNYTRPIDSWNGPAWEMRYGIGGTHALVVPFMNFRMVGVFLIPALWTYLFLRYERTIVRHISVIKLSFLAVVVMASPHWLWYGEKNIINAIILWLIFAFFYRVSLALSYKPGNKYSIITSRY